MKSLKLYAFLLPLIFPIVSAAQSGQSGSPVAADFFDSAPSEIVSWLSPVNRLDMVDYFNSGSAIGTDNRLGGKVRIVAMGDCQIEWQDDDSVSTSLCVLPAAKDTVLMVIRTFPGRVADSEIKFYTSDWRPASVAPLAMPTLENWMAPGTARKDKAAVAAAIPFMLSTASYSPDSGILTLTNNVRSYFAEKDVPAEAALLVPELTYQWTGKTFKPTGR